MTHAASIVERSRVRLTAKADDLAQRVKLYRAVGYHCSADVLEDRLELVRWQLRQLEQGVVRHANRTPDRGKVLVTPSIQAQFEHPTPKSASF